MKKILCAVSICVASLSFMMYLLFICFQEPNQGKIIFTAATCIFSMLVAMYCEERIMVK